MAFPFTPDRDWSNVPEGESPPPGAPVADDAWFEAVEDALHEHDAHQDAVYAVHGGLVGYVADSDDPPTAPPNGLMWFRPDTDERVINTGTSGTPVWDQLADDVYKLTTADLVSDYVISGLLPSVPTPTSLAPTIPSGTAYIIGKRVVQASGAHTVPERKATLVDLSDEGVYSNVDYGILLDDTEDVWNEKTDADFTVSVVAGPTGLGNAVRFAIASGASAGDSVSEAIPVADLSGYGKIAVWMRSSVTTTSGQLQFLLDDTAFVASPVHTLNVPALTANTWTLCEMAYTSTTGTNAIISVGLKYTSDIGAANVDICKPFALKATVPAVSTDSIRLFEARASANIQQVNTVTVTSAVNSTIYTVTINGVDNTYTSDASATTAEIAAGLAAAINASVDVLVTPVTATYVSGATFTVSADVAGTGFTIAVGTNLSQAATVANSAATVLSITDMRDVTPVVNGLASVSGAAAEDITFTPAGTIAATDVQAAIEEVASEASGGTTLPVVDTTAIVKDATDNTKLVRVEAGSIATGTTRVITMPNADVDLGDTAAHIADATDAHDASAISFSPTGTIAATDVQAALAEVASEAGGGSGAAEDITFTPAGTIAATDVQAAIEEVASEATGGSGYIPAWVGQTSSAIFAAYGDGNPQTPAFLQLVAPTLTSNILTPTALGTTVAHAVRFRLPKALSVTAVRSMPIGGTTNQFRFGIYPASAGSSLLWDSGTFTTVAGTWLNLTASTPFSLTANTDYYFCVATVSTGLTNTFNTLPSYSQTGFFGAAAAPLGGRSVGIPSLVQFTVSAGVLQATLPSVSAIALTTPSVPFVWLEGTAS